MQTPEYATEQPQIGKNKIKRKKMRNTDLTRFDNCNILGKERERDLLNQSIQVTKYGDNTPQYIAKESTKKRKPKDLNLDKKRIQNQIRKCQASSISRLIQVISRLINSLTENWLTTIVD